MKFTQNNKNNKGNNYYLDINKLREYDFSQITKVVSDTLLFYTQITRSNKTKIIQYEDHSTYIFAKFLKYYTKLPNNNNNKQFINNVILKKPILAKFMLVPKVIFPSTGDVQMAYLMYYFGMWGGDAKLNFYKTYKFSGKKEIINLYDVNVMSKEIINKLQSPNIDKIPFIYDESMMKST